MKVHGFDKQREAEMTAPEDLTSDHHSAMDMADVTDPVSVIQDNLDFDDPSSGKWYMPSSDGQDGNYDVEFDDTPGVGITGNLDMGSLNGVPSDPNDTPARETPQGSQQNRSQSKYGSDIHAGLDLADEPQEQFSGGDSQFAPELLERARQYGIDAYEAQSYSSAADLERTILALDRGALNEGLRQAQLQQQQYHYGAVPPQQNPGQAYQGPAQNQQQQVPQQAPVQQEDQQQFDIPDFELDETMLDDGAAEVLSTMKEHYNKVLKDMYAQQREVQSRVEFAERMAQEQYQRQQREQQEAFMRDFDNAINDLGSAFQSAFGTGSTSELNPNSQEFHNRQRLYQGYATAAQAHAQMGRQPDVKSSVGNMARILFPQQAEQALLQQVGNKSQRRQSQMLNRPTSRNAQDPGRNPEVRRENALRRVDQAFINSGLGTEGVDNFQDGV